MRNVFQILIPPKGLLLKLKKEAENPKEVLDQVLHEKLAKLPKHFSYVLNFFSLRVSDLLTANTSIQRIKWMCPLESLEYRVPTLAFKPPAGVYIGTVCLWQRRGVDTAQYAFQALCKVECFPLRQLFCDISVTYSPSGMFFITLTPGCHKDCLCYGKVTLRITRL